MKTTLALSLIFSLSLGSGVQAQTQDIAEVVVSIPAANHGWTSGVLYHASQAKEYLARLYPRHHITIKTSANATEQIKQLQELSTAKKIAALIILPHESQPLTAPVRKIVDQGVFVTVVDRNLSDQTARNAYVGGDNVGFGRIAGQYIGAKLGTQGGNVVVLRGLKSVIDDQRNRAFQEALKQYPAVKILDDQYGNWNRPDAKRVMQSYLSRFPKIDAVWASDDDMALGVLEALRESGRRDVRVVLGGSGMKEMVKKIMDGDPLVTADVTYSPSMIADAMHLTLKSLAGEQPIPPKTLRPSVLITKENAGKYYFPQSPY
ncbi:substrate-binding domain-containing protein [Deinococcus hopiensis]|uniref:Ribose transport system substrate-binding protein n=1 Tax=Deinococcus hopiensis KR-140 TaxID=695939 RepID=A0A1W1U9L8_9DEIO|nr:substrate-binding domain-containing protein [Deinococcus hopiensis]SMB77732.1 ribose transport system substrate-binding protein [Deinococcus hopiensis KR-140]